MGWTLTCQSNHPLAQVCFLYADTIISKAFIHMNFFGSHGFRFYYPFYIVCLANINEDFLYLITVLGTINLGTTLLQACLKFICQFINMLHSIMLHFPEILTESFNILIFVSIQAGTWILLCKLGERPLHNVILKLFLYFLFQISVCHDYLPPSKFSTAIINSLLGPCTPRLRTRSISAVRLGPVTKPR